MPRDTVIAYEGRIEDGGCRVDRVRRNGPAPLDPRRDLRDHSPSGLAWGYGGSGPAQLALALLADHLHDDPRALGLYQDFKQLVVAGLDSDEGWQLTPDAMDMAVRMIEAGQAAADLGGSGDAT